MGIKQIPNQDVLFVSIEGETCYQHVSGLAIIDGRESPGFGFDKFRAHVTARLGLVPQFRWKLVEVPMGLDKPYWVEDQDFDFDNHIKRIAVPSPGDSKAVAETIGLLYARHLDRNRPLWEVWFLEGLENGRNGMMFTTHHVMMDGEGASIIAKALFKMGKDAPYQDIDPAIATAKPGKIPSRKEIYQHTASHWANLPWEASKLIYNGLVRPSVQKWLKESQDKEETAVEPEERAQIGLAPFNGKISRYRGFVFGTVQMDDVLAVKKHFGVSVNDVVMAIVGGCLRGYLLDHRSLPEESLLAAMVVSLRTEQDDHFSNKVTNMSVSLATDQADPLLRIKTINRESMRAKELARAKKNVGIMEIVQLFPPVLVGALNGLSSVEQKAQMAGSNLVISYVRNSPTPLYLDEAKVEAYYPVSIIVDGQGLNVTCVSYLDKVQFGITFDPKLVPDAWSLVTRLQDALDEYLGLIKAESDKSNKSESKQAKAKRAVRSRRAARGKSKLETVKL